MSSLIFPSLSGQDIAITREPVFSTLTKTSLSGRELRTTYSTHPRYRYTISFNALRSGASYLEFQKVMGFITRHFGMLDSFLFTDAEDNAVTAHAFGVGDASTTSFQLQRTLVAAADLAAPLLRAYWPTIGDGYEPIWELNGSPQIYKDTGAGPVLLTNVTDYTLPGNGVVQFVTAPATNAILTWTGSYYRRVRFDIDSLPADRVVTALWRAKAIPLISVKPSESVSMVPMLQPKMFEETPAGTINGTTGSDGNVTFTLSRTPVAGYVIEGFRNGIHLTNGSDFTVSGATITALAPNIPVTGDSYVFNYYSYA